MPIEDMVEIVEGERVLKMTEAEVPVECGITKSGRVRKDLGFRYSVWNKEVKRAIK